MKYSETVAVVYRITSAYPSQARLLSNEMIEDMIREWHQSLKTLSPDYVMEAVTALVAEQKWMPSLSEVIGKILDAQYGTDYDIIRALDKIISRSSTCIIFGEVTDEQEEGYAKLSPFQQLIVKSPYEFNLWLTKSIEWKAERVRLVKREISHGRHMDYLNGNQPKQLGDGFDVFKALEERKHGQDQ